MRRSPRVALAAVAALLAACGGSERPAPITPSLPATDTPVAEAPPPAAAPAPADSGPVEPTVLSDADRARDAARVALASAVVDAYPNSNGFFSSLVASYAPDGRSFLFGSTRDGLPQIYRAPTGKPGAPAVTITSGVERALWADYTRDGKAILFTRDQRGDENHAIWRVGLDGGEPVLLTPGETLKRTPPHLPRKRPDTMFYAARSTRETTTRFYTQPVAGGEARLVYTQALPGALADVTADGARALVTAMASNQDVVTHEVDVATGAARRLYPPEGTQVGLYDATYDAAGTRVLIATDAGDQVVVLALDPATGKELGRFVNRELPTAALTVRPSPRGDRIALGIDAGNHGQVKILDARTLAVQRTVKVPLGEVKLGDFRGDGRAFSILVSRPEQPADVFEVDAATGAVKPLRADPRPGLASLPPITSSIQSARAFDGLTIPINQYLPPVDGKKLPTLVIFHGGPASSYAVRWFPYTRFFVSLGYAVVEPNVRGSTGFGRAYEAADNREKRADWLKDVETVNTWVKAQPWCDPERVVVWGQSYGGYTTLMALTRQPTRWRAGVDLYGPADLRSLLLTTDATIRQIFVTEFGDVDRDAALLAEWSPMRDIARIARPLFVYAGQNDPRVPRSESDTIVRALRARQVPVEYMVAASEGHTVDRRETKIELLTRAARFLEDALK
jgi:dipeptidyl aminopeptidase/acylaminoacyl peptidase